MGPLSSCLRDASRGFTLAEMLVVLLVIGLAGGLAYAELSGSERNDVLRESQRLTDALEHAALAAQWRGEAIAWVAQGAGYRFLRRSTDADPWSGIDDDDVLRARRVPSEMSVSAKMLSGAPVPPDTPILFRPSARNEPYLIEVNSVHWHTSLTADPLNRIRLSTPIEVSKEAS